METLLQVAQLGAPVLRQKAKKINDAGDASVQKLIEDMLATVKDVSGLGIAAPQVYQSLRLFIVASHPNQRYPDAPYMDPLAMINPHILSHSEEEYLDWEGCLSIPGLRGCVPRWRWIEVEYTDASGSKHQKKFSALVARIFQHELDHLDGILFVDRVRSSRDLMTDKEYLKMLEKKK